MGTVIKCIEPKAPNFTLSKYVHPFTITTIRRAQYLNYHYCPLLENLKYFPL